MTADDDREGSLDVAQAMRQQRGGERDHEADDDRDHASA